MSDAPGFNQCGFNECGTLRRVALRHPSTAFASQDFIDASWRDLNYLAPPDHARALARGYRTNDAGIAQLKALLGPGVEVVTVARTDAQF